MTTTETRVVTTQVTATRQNRQWNSGLFGCMQDVKSCACVVFCPLCYSCVLADRMDEHRLMPCCIGLPLANMAMRLKLRMMLGIEGSIWRDCCMTTWCSPCVMCQLGREMDSAGM